MNEELLGTEEEERKMKCAQVLTVNGVLRLQQGQNRLNKRDSFKQVSSYPINRYWEGSIDNIYFNNFNNKTLNEFEIFLKK